MSRNSPSRLRTRTVRIGIAAYQHLMVLAQAHDSSVAEELDRLLGNESKQLVFPVVPPVTRLVAPGASQVQVVRPSILVKPKVVRRSDGKAS